MRNLHHVQSSHECHCRCAARLNLAQKLGSRLTSSALAMKMAATAMATRRWIDGCVFSLGKKTVCPFQHAHIVCFVLWVSNLTVLIALPRVVSLFEVRGLLAACLWVQARSQV